MRVTRAKADENRARLIEAAGRLFRERGFDGIGIVDLMKAVGLTHGGFYGNFESKDHLAAEACEAALAAFRERWQDTTDVDGIPALERMLSFYVSQKHRDNPGRGCPLSALAADAARHPGPVLSAFGAGIDSYVDAFTGLVPGRTERVRRERAISLLSGMVGSVILARATDDPSLSDEILKSTLATLLQGVRRPVPAAAGSRDDLGADEFGATSESLTGTS